MRPFYLNYSLFSILHYLLNQPPALAEGWFGGRGRIRTIEAKRNRFTVCPLWPLGNSPICNIAKIKWSWWTDSNPRPADYKSAALPTELHQHLRYAFICLSSLSPDDYIIIPHDFSFVKRFSKKNYIFLNFLFPSQFRRFSHVFMPLGMAFSEDCEKCINGDSVFYGFFVATQPPQPIDFLAEKRYHRNNITT